MSRPMLVLQRFRPEGLLACGGMVLVQIAEDVVLGGRAVLKTLRPDVDEDNVDRFEHEIEVARAMRSLTRVPRLLDDGFHDGERVAVFKHVDGASLTALQRERVTLTPRRAVSVVIDVLMALQQVHALGADDAAGRAVRRVEPAHARPAPRVSTRRSHP